MARLSRLAARFAAAFYRAREREWIARLQKCSHVKRETDPVQGKGRGGAWLSVFRYTSFARSKLQDIIEGSGTPANAG
jgi:hypothetical protein